MCKPVANLFDRVIAVDIACRVPAAIFFILQEINPFVGCLMPFQGPFLAHLNFINSLLDLL